MLQSVLSPFAPAQPERWTSYRTLEGFTVAECVVEQLESEGVDAVFGIPGGYVSPFLAVLRGHPRMRYVIACHEGGAAFMADGYARASGKLGVCLVTAGPGATNALTGIASAHLDGVPVLAITGQVPTDRFGLAAMQESTVEGGVDTVALLRHASAYSTSVGDAGSFPRLFRRALNVAHGVPRGAVHLSFPANVARQRLDRVSLPAAPDRRPPLPTCDPADVEAAFRLLTAARRPLIYVGSGSRDALSVLGAHFQDFVSRWGIPVATSMRGKGLFPESHELSLGVLGMAGNRRADRYMRDGVDVMMVLGSRLGEWSSQNFSPNIRATHAVIQVDVNPATIGQLLPPQLPIVADIHAVLRGLVECARGAGEPDPLPTAERRAAVQWVREEVSPYVEPTKLTDDASPLKPQRLMAELNACMDGDTDLYVDMGNCTGWATHCLTVSPPTRVFYPSGLSSMGWSCGAVIGGKMARPERAAVALVGDGAFLMNGTEVNTAARYGVGAVYVVLNDDSLGMVNHGEHAQSGAYPLDDPFYGLGGPDLAKFSESLGATAHVVDRPGQLQALLPGVLLRAGAEGRPQVIVARIDPREVPPYGSRFESVRGSAGAPGR